MNDIEFAQRISSKIGARYHEAKRSSAKFPKHALTQIRALAALCCDALARPGGVVPCGLEQKISELYRLHRINPDTRELLDQLRRWGNQAAHPEESLLTDKQFASHAINALVAARKLLELLFQHIHAGAAVPAYEVSEDSLEEIKDLCFRALIGNSATDQYQVAIHLLMQSDAINIKAQACAMDRKPTHELDMEIRAIKARALDLLGYASDAGHAAASYEFGLALANGTRGDEMMARGRNLIACACRDGDIDALAWCGQSAMLGINDYDIDYDLARRYLEQAAAEDHPAALTLLASIHREGLGVSADAGAAFALMLRAAKAGYPLAQWSVSVFLSGGHGIDVDDAAALEWLRKASDAGQAQAQTKLARLMRDRKIAGSFDDIEALLLPAGRKFNDALLELASLYLEQGTLAKHLLMAATLLQRCYEAALKDKDELLADECWRRAPACVEKMKVERLLTF